MSGKVKAALARGRSTRRLQIAELAAGRSMGTGLHLAGLPVQTQMDISPAAFLSAFTDVGDSQYIHDGVDESLLRALNNGVVYGSSVGHCHECPFQDITIEVIAKVERLARRNGVPMRPHILPKRLPKPVRKEVIVAKVHPPGSKLLFSERQRQIVGAIAAGLTAEQAGELLDLSPRSVKMHADRLRDRLNVRRRRDIPLAFYKMTGENVFDMLDKVEPVVKTPDPRQGKSLLEVVSEMFDS